MTDLHTHILPGIDDGALDLKTAIEIIEMEKEQRVFNVALTSHYDCEYMDFEVFRERRKESFDKVRRCKQVIKTNIHFKLGCEVQYSPRLLQMDIHPLCIEDTRLILLELPTMYRPQFLTEMLNYCQTEGITPLIAHVERYSYVLECPQILAEWIKMGAYAQINADTLLGKDRQVKMAFDFLRWGLVQVIASDVHSLNRRPVRLEQAFHKVENRLGKDVAYRLKKNANLLFSGEDLNDNTFHYPKRILGQWI